MSNTPALLFSNTCVDIGVGANLVHGMQKLKVDLVKFDSSMSLTSGFLCLAQESCVWETYLMSFVCLEATQNTRNKKPAV